jgi:hypothetical protein
MTANTQNRAAVSPKSEVTGKQKRLAGPDRDGTLMRGCNPHEW